MSDKAITLTSSNVDRMIRDCLFGSPELTDDAIKVEGVLRVFVLSRSKLDQHRDALIDMLQALPDDFLVGPGKGGGSTFLNLCMDRHGRQWTGFHAEQEVLCVLAIGAGLAHWSLPRECWDVLPGGVPYVGFKLPAEPAPESGASANVT